MTASSQRTLRLATAGAVALYALVVLGGSDSRPVEVFGAVGQVVAAVLAAWACRRAAPRAVGRAHRRGWLLFGVSAATWALGAVVRVGYAAAEQPVPLPSVADAAFLAAIPLALVGVWMMSAHTSMSSWMTAFLDGLIMAGGLAAIGWVVGLQSAWDRSSQAPATLVLALAYPTAMLVVAASALLAIMQADRKRDPAPLGRLALSMATLFAADALAVFDTLDGRVTGLSLVDVLRVAAFAQLMLAAFSYPRPVADGAPDRTPAHTMTRAVLPLTVVGVAWLIRMITLIVEGPEDPFLTVIMVTTIGLVVLRYLTTLQENEALTASLEEKIGELTVRESQLTHQAYHDPLTGLANRRLFSDRVEAALARGGRDRERTAVLFVDLDDFKTVNDSLGHAIGDRLLTSVAARLSGCVRPGDTVARLGGDEFGILLEHMDDPDHASRVASRILQSLDVAFPLAGRQVFTRASIGVATADDLEPTEVSDLLADADVALYAAKGAGKSTFKEFRSTMRSTALERLELGQDLRKAVERDEFFCSYQPIVDLVTRRIVGLEALVRWDHPTRGVVGPDSFIDLAEESGTIGDIGMAVLEMAAWQGANWRIDGKIGPAVEVHVNLSGRQLEDATLVDNVMRVLGSTGFPPQLLVLEITESVAVEIGAARIGVLEQLRARGVRLAIDDFGTGYSSLNYLRALPVDVLKIDRAFAQTGDGRTDTVLLEAIVRLGHSLGIDMIAEGIELDEQAATLRRLGCRRAQGYLFHRPLSVSEVPATVAASAGPAAPGPVPERDAPDATPSTGD